MVQGKKCGCGRTLVRLRKHAHARCWDCGRIPSNCDCPRITEGFTIHITSRAHGLGEFAAQFMNMSVDEWASKVMTDVGQAFHDSIPNMAEILFGDGPQPERPVPITKMTKARREGLNRD